MGVRFFTPIDDCSCFGVASYSRCQRVVDTISEVIKKFDDILFAVDIDVAKATLNEVGPGQDDALAVMNMEVTDKHHLFDTRHVLTYLL
mmetsp:Transcript_12820/g.32817  ORF Transcript_12820/g.32817 Transcript_12820/m.32817 type:complete len:89 (+) Transcript_12820:233-499(+)